MPWTRIAPAIDATVRGLCTRRYPGHPRGCPNYGMRATCPPRAPLLDRLLDLSEPVWVVWNAFDLAGHVERMREKHASWSDRQLHCCLYWQGTARKALREEIARLVNRPPLCPFRVVKCPEACGVNVTATMVNIGVHLEWPPRKVAYQVALAGSPWRGNAQEGESDECSGSP